MQLSQSYALEVENNKTMLMKILSCIKFLARQGLPLRGDLDENDGNFLQLLKFQDNDLVIDWLQKKCNRYTSHEIQNEILRVMGLHVLRSIADQIQSSPFITVMIDETNDVTNQEQVAIVFRRVDGNLDVCEEFVGLYHVDSIGAESLTAVIKDTMIRLNLSMSRLRGQCYDGCSTMSGARTGVAKRIADEEPRAVYTHCYGHSLNLAASDTIKKSKVMKNALDTTHEITKLVVKFSPRCDAIFNDLKAENNNHTASIRILCPTR